MKSAYVLVIYLSLFPLLLANEIHSISFNSSDWKHLKFKSIKSNQVEFKKNALLIKVNHSASPLIYPLPKPSRIKEVELEINIEGKLNLSDQPQGSIKNDDFLFRLGLVYEGDKRLNFMQRMIAANWLKQLFELAEEKQGISEVVFYNVYSDVRLKNQERRHPQSELFLEKYYLEKKQQIRTKINIDDSRDVLAFWISSDGDDTKSDFRVEIKSLRYK